MESAAVRAVSTRILLCSSGKNPAHLVKPSCIKGEAEGQSDQALKDPEAWWDAPQPVSSLPGGGALL